MAYDAAKDKRLHVAPEIDGDNGSTILVGIFSYDGADPRARINRSKHLRTGETVVTKLGGMSRREALAVGQGLVELAGDDSAWK